MINSLDPATLNFLTGMQQIQSRSERAQRELTTGLRINSISDDPGKVPLLMETRAQLASAKQITDNLGSIKTETDTAESALEAASKLMDQAQTLATQGQSGLLSAQDRNAIANQLGGILQQLVGISATTVDGRHIFSGDNDQQAPYTIDLTQTNPISIYAGAAGTRQAQHPDGSLFNVARTAQDIFDSPNAQQNVFTSINNLRVGLLNNDQAAIDAALPDVRTAGTYLNGQLSFYGTVQNHVQDGLDFGATLQTQLQTQLSGIQDADLTQSIVDLNQAKIDQQAALTSEAQLPRTSLFNYLA
jgi:flagellar hook-associated protein 3 FlgL